MAVCLNRKMTTKQLVRKWINDMIKHGFMRGWMGDTSKEFKDTQFKCLMEVVNGDVQAIGGNYRLLATIESDYLNLKNYCGWKHKELKQLLSIFGFKSIDQVCAVKAQTGADMKLYMENGKLKKEVLFYLTPSLYIGK